MTALRRMTVKVFGSAAAAMALALAMPAAAQDSEAPVDVTAAPPPSAETIGPSQLRDFNLQGTVTRPADQPAPTPAQPTTSDSAPQQPSATAPAPSGSTQPREVAARPAAVTGQPGAATSPTTSAPATPSLPLEVTTSTQPQPAPEVGALPAEESLEFGNFLSWPWLAALLALVGGGAFIALSRRSRRQRYGDPGRMAFAGLAPDVVPEARPVPPARPRPDPIPPRAQPAPPPTPAPRPDPTPPSVPAPAPEAARDDGLIVATRLRPQLGLEFRPDRAVVTEREVLLQYDVVISNVGTAPARDVLVEARLIAASATQDREIAAFFQQPLKAGDRMAGIEPFGKLSLKSAVRLPLDQVHSFELEGRKLFVPLVAFNILYRSGAGEELASASYLVGRGSEEDEKLAPFRLDLGPRIFRGLSARPHSNGLKRQLA